MGILIMKLQSLAFFAQLSCTYTQTHTRCAKKFSAIISKNSHLWAACLRFDLTAILNNSNNHALRNALTSVSRAPVPGTKRDAIDDEILIISSLSSLVLNPEIH